MKCSWTARVIDTTCAVCRVVVESTPVEISMISSTITYRDPAQILLDTQGQHVREPTDDIECVSFVSGGTGKLLSASHLRLSKVDDTNVVLGTWLYEKARAVALCVCVCVMSLTRAACNVTDASQQNMLPIATHHNIVLQLAYSGTSEIEIPIHLITRSGVRYSETVTCSTGSRPLSRVGGLRTASFMPTLSE